MGSRQSGRGAVYALLLAGAVTAACAPTYVVVPEKRDGYTARDTLHGQLKGKDVRVTFQHVTISRVDTITKWRTIYRNGSRVDTVYNDTTRRVDTVKVGTGGGGGRRPEGRVDTVRVVVHDTVRARTPTDNKGPGTTGTGGVPVVVPQRPPTTGTGSGNTGGPVIVPQRPPPADPRVDTLRVTVRDTLRITVHDSIRITVYDTVRRVDTLRVGVDTVRLPGQRTVFIPPGQYPPDGQCRLWIVDVPPGQQARPAACNALGAIPPGAFVLFRDKAWDADYDWASDPNAASVPPEILNLRRPSTARPATSRGRGRS